jgi:hypothetical protein
LSSVLRGSFQIGADRRAWCAPISAGSHRRCMVVRVVISAGPAQQRLAQMAFQHLRHQPGRGAAQRRELLQQRAAVLAALDRERSAHRPGRGCGLQPRHRALLLLGGMRHLLPDTGGEYRSAVLGCRAGAVNAAAMPQPSPRRRQAADPREAQRGDLGEFGADRLPGGSMNLLDPGRRAGARPDRPGRDIAGRDGHGRRLAPATACPAPRGCRWRRAASPPAMPGMQPPPLATPVSSTASRSGRGVEALRLVPSARRAGASGRSRHGRSAGCCAWSGESTIGAGRGMARQGLALSQARGPRRSASAAKREPLARAGDLGEIARDGFGEAGGEGLCHGAGLADSRAGWQQGSSLLPSRERLRKRNAIPLPLVGRGRGGGGAAGWAVAGLASTVHPTSQRRAWLYDPHPCPSPQGGGVRALLNNRTAQISACARTQASQTRGSGAPRGALGLSSASVEPGCGADGLSHHPHAPWRSACRRFWAPGRAYRVEGQPPPRALDASSPHRVVAPSGMGRRREP